MNVPFGLWIFNFFKSETKRTVPSVSPTKKEPILFLIIYALFNLIRTTFC